MQHIVSIVLLLYMHNSSKTKVVLHSHCHASFVNCLHGTYPERTKKLGVARAYDTRRCVHHTGLTLITTYANHAAGCMHAVLDMPTKHHACMQLMTIGA